MKKYFVHKDRKCKLRDTYIWNVKYRYSLTQLDSHKYKDAFSLSIDAWSQLMYLLVRKRALMKVSIPSVRAHPHWFHSHSSNSRWRTSIPPAHLTRRERTFSPCHAGHHQLGTQSTLKGTVQCKNTPHTPEINTESHFTPQFCLLTHFGERWQRSSALRCLRLTWCRLVKRDYDDEWACRHGNCSPNFSQGVNEIINS